MRTDRNNNPAAFTTDIAKEAGLVEGVDYEVGDPFTSLGHTYYTAKLLRDPIGLTIEVISKIGFFTSTLSPRWTYTPDLTLHMWAMLNSVQQAEIIGLMYHHEGGVALQSLFNKVEDVAINVAVSNTLSMGDKIG